MKRPRSIDRKRSFSYNTGVLRGAADIVVRCAFISYPAQSEDPLYERMITMPDDSRYRMSREHLEELKEKLEYLQTVREKEVSEQIREARSFGDLSENSEYDEAKTEQGRLYSQIADLRDLIENAVIIEVTRTGSRGVVMGSRVTVREQSDTETETYEIVGSQEADPMAGRISDESPLGRSLMGHREGDVVSFEAPAGVLRYEIVRIEN